MPVRGLAQQVRRALHANEHCRRLPDEVLSHEVRQQEGARQQPVQSIAAFRAHTHISTRVMLRLSAKFKAHTSRKMQQYPPATLCHKTPSFLARGKAEVLLESVILLQAPTCMCVCESRRRKWIAY